MSRIRLKLAIIALLGLAGTSLAHAQTALFSLNRHSIEHLPDCDSSWLALRIKHRFNTTEGRFWDTDLRMDEVEHLRLAGERPKADGLIARRWCEGTALFNDGRKRRVAIELASDMGIIGVGYGLHTCVEGLDRHNAYAPDCRVLRPRSF